MRKKISGRAVACNGSETRFLATKMRRAIEAPPHQSSSGYSERRKLRMSCCDPVQVDVVLQVAGRLLKSTITWQASPIAVVQLVESLPALGAWSLIASNTLSARPSWIKNSRWPAPHSGAVRNWVGPALPCVTLSDKLESMVWMAKSENGRNGALLSSGVSEVVVLRAFEWQSTQPMLLTLVVFGLSSATLLVKEPWRVESRLPNSFAPLWAEASKAPHTPAALL